MTIAVRIDSLRPGLSDSASSVVRLNGIGPIDLSVEAGECVAVDGDPAEAAGCVLKVLAGETSAGAGRVLVRHGGEDVDLARAEPWILMEARRITLGVVSGGLRFMPRLPVLDVVAEPALRAGRMPAVAHATARRLLEMLEVPWSVWNVPPAALSSSERRRASIARGFSVEYPILLLDRPTQGLEPEHRRTVIRLLQQAKRRGSALIGQFGDDEAAAELADRTITVRTRASNAA